MLSSSIRSTRPRSAGCQAARPRACRACSSRGVSAVHSSGGGIGVPGRMPPLSIMYGATGSRATSGASSAAASSGGRRGSMAPMRERARPSPVDRDHEAAEQDLGQRVVDLGRQRRAGEDAEPADPGVDDLDVRAGACARIAESTPSAPTSTSPSALRAVVEQQPHAVAVALEAGGPGARRCDGVVEPRGEDLAQRPAVDRRVRPLAVVRRAEVRRPSRARCACESTTTDIAPRRRVARGLRGRARRGRRAGRPRSASPPSPLIVIR